MEQTPYGKELEAAEIRRDDEERQRRILINRVGRNIIPKMEGLERVLRTYEPTNNTPRRIIEEIIHGLLELTHEGSSVGVVVLKDHTFINGQRVKLDTGMHETCGRFGERLAQVGIAGLTMAVGFSVDSLVQFFLLLRDTKKMEDPTEARQFIGDGLIAADIHDVSLILRDDIIRDYGGDDQGPGKVQYEAVNAYVRGMAAIGKTNAGQSSVGQRRRQRSAVRKLVSVGEENLAAVVALTGVRDIGVAEQNHAMNTAILCIALGMRMGLSRRDLVRLGLAAMNHNIGESLLPSGMLEVDRELTDEEREVMQSHPLAGMRHLLLNHGLTQPILERALVSAEHHEWINGRGGYPLLLRPQLHVFSRIVAVCDTFDALALHRPYRKTFMPDEALKLVLRGAGTRFDPVIVRMLVTVVGRYPPGSLVELDTGEWAVVLGPGDGDQPTTRPKILIIRDPLGRKIEPPIEVDTHERHSRRKAFLRTVVRAHNAHDYRIPVTRLICGDRIFLADEGTNTQLEGGFL